MTRIATAVLTAACLVALVASCTRENAAFCCTSPEDCAAKGVDEASRPCADGLACVANTCVVASCASAGCAAAAPVCEISSDTCTGCSDSSDCARFAGTGVCDPVSGACVECAGPSDCSAAFPVCEDNACRTCALDSECSSGACAEDGTCVPEANVAYLATTGTNAAPCSRAQPCNDLRFAVQQTNAMRSHVVFAPGDYETQLGIFLGTQTTTASPLSIHGAGATLTGISSDGTLGLELPTILRDLELVNQAGRALTVSTTATAERIKVRGREGVGTSGTVTLRDMDIRTTGAAVILNGGSLRLERAVIRGGTKGVVVVAPTVVDITSVAISGSSEIGLDLSGATGRVSFISVADTGAGGAGPTSVICTHTSLEIASSIMWSAGSTRPTVQGGCQIRSSIVGPTGIAGAMNVDPLFENAIIGNLHLKSGSPARDAVDAGPATDFERDPRPQGPRFDLGADEAP